MQHHLCKILSVRYKLVVKQLLGCMYLKKHTRLSIERVRKVKKGHKVDKLARMIFNARKIKCPI
jgi:hypothetical protein